ncbi:DUF3048 domain-containing protein [Candidatus Nomurabacteria bacterium]|nr:DUF3048 domain-containing protein [Candidatus Nomurabacteria bacterium]
MKAKNLNISDIGLGASKSTPATPTVQASRTFKNPTIQKIYDKWNKASKKQKALIVGIPSILLLAIAGLILFQVVTYDPSNKKNLFGLGVDFLEGGKQNTENNLDAKAPEQPKTFESPLNGVLIDENRVDELKKKRPVAVMVNNHVAARPQSNLSKADIVYEALVESGITRYMAIYWSNDVNKVGPIRSARQYYLEWLSPYDAIYIHDGYASSTDPKVDAGGNIYSYGIKSISTQNAWRVYDEGRVAPHNEYSSITAAWETAKKNGWDQLPEIDSWKFKNDATVESRGEKTEASIVFHQRLRNNGLYDAKWVYEPGSNSYLRYIGGVEDIDHETNKQINAKNVVLQEMEMTPTYDEKAHIILTTIGKGKATILRDGVVINGTWEKTSRTSRTQFYDADGAKIEFNRGLIWISVIPSNDGSSDIIQ